MRNLLFFLLVFNTLFANANQQATEIYVDLQKLHALKRVLYIAAHPDDENTRALAWFSLGEMAETAYLSLTRGDGGQNLIGDELSEDLGVLRTQELLAARRFDGAKQFFSRAVDFGYSKSAKESFEKWGRAELLTDVVRVIRQFKPDVIITRFPPDKRAGHGHHTASAILAIEAFEKAADPSFLPQQVAEYGTWKTTSIYWNSSVWWDKDLGEKAKNNPDYLIADIGGYNARLGMSFNEIGTLARSEHKCQGFGAVIERGSRIEYFKHLGGVKLKNSFFEEHTASWAQLIDANFQTQLENLLMDFDFVNPANNISDLLVIRKALDLLPNSLFKREKIERCDQIIIDCLGLYIEIVGKDFAFTQGENVTFDLNLINRSTIEVIIESFKNGEEIVKVNQALRQNEIITQSIPVQIKAPLSNPFWLEVPFMNLFTVRDRINLGRAIGAPTFSKDITLDIEGSRLTIPVPVTYKWRDPSYGERKRAIISAPKFSLNFDQEIAIIKPNHSKLIRAKVHSFMSHLTDEIQIEAPSGWTVSPATIEVEVADKHGDQWVEFTLTPNETSARGEIQFKSKSGEKLFAYTEIAYDHIPTQVIFKPSTLTCIRLDAKIKSGKIAYIKGVDDAVPEAIAQLGFEVDVFAVDDLATIDLSIYQTVVLGIRIYNVFPELSNYTDAFKKYITDGGNLVMQYNTASRSAKGQTYGPLPFKLSRNRVTEEDAKVTFLAPSHPIMNVPNKITQTDFKGWVQERGLYFATDWDNAFTPLFSWHDQGETAQEGALIVAKLGKGQFIYTGISFFRELPNGVEGAYRLFANLLSY